MLSSINFLSSHWWQLLAMVILAVAFYRSRLCDYLRALLFPANQLKIVAVNIAHEFGHDAPGFAIARQRAAKERGNFFQHGLWWRISVEIRRQRHTGNEHHSRPQ
jgi:hypothetical protein